MLQLLKPDVICLQENKIKRLKKETHINGYVIHEVPAGGISRGLLMGFRNDSNIDFKIIESRYHVILASINDSVIIGNIYRFTNSGTSKLTTQKVVDILKTEKSECLLVGDWNKKPSVMERKLSKKGIQVYTTGAPIRGTRIYRNRKRTKRAIDYDLSNCDQLINTQKVRYNWNISDHLPVEVNISLIVLKKAIALKRIKDTEIRKGLPPLNELVQMKKNIIKEIRAHKKNLI